MTNTDPISDPVHGRTAILAGSGKLPEVIAAELAAAKSNPLVIAVSDDTGGWVSNHDHVPFLVPQLSAIIKTLKAGGISNVVMAGGIKVRPSLNSFKLDWMTLALLPRLFLALRKGDDGLLRAAVKFLESHGFKVVGAHQLAPALLTPLGKLTLLAPASQDEADIAIAVAETQRLGRADIGQAAVARGGQVIAAEDRRGTKGMLGEIAQSQAGFSRSGVLAKFAKPQQEIRVDLPAIGPETVEQAAAAGLAGIVVEAGRSLMLERALTIAKANELGLFIVGMRGVRS